MRSPGVEEMHEVPSMRARIVAVKGVPVEQVEMTPERPGRCAAIGA